MSAFTEKLRLIGIHNAHNYARPGEVLIDYTPANNGRGGHAAYWSVFRVGGFTDPHSKNWQDRGNKTIALFGKGRLEVLEEILEWSSKKYGVTDWARTPFGSYMDAEIVTARDAEFREQVKDLVVPLRVWGIGSHDDRHGYPAAHTRRRIIAVKSKAAAGRALGIRGGEFSRWGGETGNATELEIARSQPGVVFVSTGPNTYEPEVKP